MTFSPAPGSRVLIPSTGRRNSTRLSMRVSRVCRTPHYWHTQTLPHLLHSSRTPPLPPWVPYYHTHNYKWMDVHPNPISLSLDKMSLSIHITRRHYQDIFLNMSDYYPICSIMFCSCTDLDCSQTNTLRMTKLCLLYSYAR
jgi:hypothetical protein